MRGTLKSVSHRLAAGVVFIALLGAQSVATAASSAPKKSAELLLRILAYDRNLPKRPGEFVTVAVLHRPGNDESRQCSEHLKQVLDTMSLSAKVADRPVQAMLIPWMGKSAAGRALTGGEVTVLWLCAGTSHVISDLIKETRERSVLTFTTSEEDLRAGVAIGVIARNGKPKIAINKAAAVAEGALFTGGIYRVAELIE